MSSSSVNGEPSLSLSLSLFPSDCGSAAVSDDVNSSLGSFEQSGRGFSDSHSVSIGEDFSNSLSQATTTHARAHKVLSDPERQYAIDCLLSKQEDLKLPPRCVIDIAAQFGVSRWTIQRLWKHVKHLLMTNQRVCVKNSFKGNCGRKRKELDYDQLMRVPLKNRSTIRSLAAAMNMTKSTVHKFIKWGKIKRHSNAMKPGLTPLNKLQRLRWCIQSVLPQSIRTIPRFRDMYNMVHIDEKWFFMSKASHNFYLAPNESKPYRSCKSKRYINKCMFVVAVARPWFSTEGDIIFDGKIGVFPLTYKVAAQRNSVNRPAGTLETKPLPKITKEVIRNIFIEQLIPAIKAKWPIDACGTLWIQQDNATPHMSEADEAFNIAGNQDGFHMHLLPQPPNSPDMNVLDLGFFRAIQSIQQQQIPKTIDELIYAVQHAFEVFHPKLLDYVFLSYQYCMIECMKVKGSNNYNIPHYGKHRMDREGTLPVSVEVPSDLLAESASELIRQYLALTEPHAHEETEETQAEDGIHVNNVYSSVQQTEAETEAIEARPTQPETEAEQ